MQSDRYNDETQFKAKLRRALQLKDVSSSAGTLNSFVTEAHIEMCWSLYQNSRNNDLGKLVCGLLTDLSNARREFKGTNDLHTGSVLNIVKSVANPGRYWSTLANDCWILGGIHAHMPFQLVSHPARETIKDPNYVDGQSNENHMMRITARELIGLARFGYRTSTSPDIDSKSRALGVKYELYCFDKAKADEATIAKYLQVVRDQAQIMKNHGAMPVRKYINQMWG
ncbi:MAG: hypothetical protein ACI92E_001694 [Oceanicoccus sp.]|jgi:hypothetical protein